MNRLGNETSLYLHQHASNPVDWHPWDESALLEARVLDRPILLSIGYSACHWCHVMAHESFEDEETADLMNRLFVNIKVDREERPDLDRSYQLAHQLLTGRGGGWPLTVFLDPVEQIPFFAGTYFPREPRYGMPAFGQVLQAISQWYAENRDEVQEQNLKLTRALASIQAPAGEQQAHADPDTVQDLLRKSAQQIIARHDVVNGGFGGAPKFPQAPLLEAIARLGELETGDKLHGGLSLTLERMALSGLRDHLDGGFFRYCVDDDWTIPHFEKMLYDNAMLLPLYAEGAQRWNSRLLRTTAEGIVDWLLKTMRQAGGAYAASMDADAAGEEGSFHVWNQQQVSAVLNARQRDVFIRSYGLDQAPNFEDKAWHLVRRVPASSVAKEFGETTESLESLLTNARQKLQAERENRIHPTLDEKQLTSWNALLAGGLVRAARALERDDWLDHAREIFRFIRNELWSGHSLLAVFNAGEARFEAYLDDYAWLLDALLQYLRLRWEREWLDFAIMLADTLLERFEDPEHGGFFFSDAAVDVPMGRRMIFQDDATPAGNAIAVMALNRMAHLLGEPAYSQAADRCLARAMPQIGESPVAHASFLSALQETVQPPPQLIISGIDPEQQSALKQWVESHYRVDCYLIGPADDSLPGILRNFRSDDPVTAWLCRGMNCLPPVRSQEELETLLK
jgi:uncharacterized protein YyaL (SSP411 family)